MKKYIAILVFPLLFSCNKGGGYTYQESSTNAINMNLVDQLQKRDSVIRGFLISFNEIQDNLNTIKLKEHIVTLQSKEQKLSKPEQEQIVDDIQLIYGLLNKNRKTITEMQQNLNRKELKIAELDSLFPKLIHQINDQETEIGTLKDSLNKMNILIDNLSEGLTKEGKESDNKTQKLNTVYCAIGTRKELIKQGIIVEKGGVAGVGQVQELDSKLIKNFFSSMDIYETTEISIAAKKVQILSNNPKDSYIIEDNNLSIKKLVITDPDEFWRVSKYLVIEVSDNTPPYYQAPSSL